VSSGEDMFDVHGDAAAYALGALEPEELEAFRRHLEDCPVCREEVASFEQAVEVLPAAAPRYEVPKGLRTRVMNEVRATPKAASSTRTRTRAPLLDWLRPRVLLAGGGFAVVVVAVIVAVVLSSGGSSARVVQASVAGSSGSAEVRIAGGQGELIVRDLPQPAAGRIYEVWFERGHNAPTPTNTLFSPTSAGRGNVGLPGSLHGVREVLVTQEPAGGTLVPTSPPVIVAQLS
jgi:anti-sigma-K factor RskA